MNFPIDGKITHVQVTTNEDIITNFQTYIPLEVSINGKDPQKGWFFFILEDPIDMND